MPPHYLGFTITLRHTTLGKTPLDEWSTWCTDLYLTTTHNIHNRQTSKPPAGFEPTIPAIERQQTHALDRTATGTDHFYTNHPNLNDDFSHTYYFKFTFSLTCLSLSYIQDTSKGAVLIRSVRDSRSSLMYWCCLQGSYGASSGCGWRNGLQYGR